MPTKLNEVIYQPLILINSGTCKSGGYKTVSLMHGRCVFEWNNPLVSTLYLPINDEVQQGTVLYTDSELTNRFDGSVSGSGEYTIMLESMMWLSVDSNGVVTDLDSCVF